ncbi:hypothetical protein GCM10010211_23420 [Streptomyces albospinus]|uniref:TauD/TfdA-like domain-containing protein n=1 Tax=Streptomyces albospinus TaxID=285515 RepID=A0ABQ2UY80_9ACTN|nr:hypothetical protein GCM10010211_23420 [Streptomyces albospinus]
MTTHPAHPLADSPALRPHRVPADGIHEGHRILRRTPDGWDDRPHEPFEAVPQAAAIGAEIRGLDPSRPLSGALRAELNRALLEWKVLFFRRQHLPSTAQGQFAANWGELETSPLLARGDSKEVARFDKTAGGVHTFESVWHTDVTFRERPAMAAVLQLREVPARGGDAMWADMAAAYDNLPVEIRERIDGARAVHDYLPGFSRFRSPAQLAPFQAAFRPVEHPVVRRHRRPGGACWSSTRRSRPGSWDWRRRGATCCCGCCSSRRRYRSSRCGSAGRPVTSRSGTTVPPSTTRCSTTARSGGWPNGWPSRGIVRMRGFP